MQKGSIAWYISQFLKENGNKPTHYREFTKYLKKKGKLNGSTPDATVISILIRNKNYFQKVKTGHYNLKK